MDRTSTRPAFPSWVFYGFQPERGKLRHQAPRRVASRNDPICADGFEEAIL